MSLLDPLFIMIACCIMQSRGYVESYNTCTMRDDISSGGKYDLTASRGVSVTLGNITGSQVVVTNPGGSDSHVYSPIYSASKMITAMVMMRIVEAPLGLSLDDRLNQHLDWWTSDDSDPRADVTLRHLLSQTSGFGGHPCILNNLNMTDFSMESWWTTELCARAIHNSSFGILVDLFSGLPVEYNVTMTPGSYFFYQESHFVLAAALALAVTGNSTWNVVFDHFIRTPLALSNECRWTFITEQNPDPGAGLTCSPREYARILHAYFSNELLTQSSTDEMESAQIPVDSIVGVPWFLLNGNHYGLGMWRVCTSESCTDPAVVHSIGYAGFYPWIDRGVGYWGVIGRNVDQGDYDRCLLECDTVNIMLQRGLQNDIASLYEDGNTPSECVERTPEPTSSPTSSPDLSSSMVALPMSQIFWITSIIMAFILRF